MTAGCNGHPSPSTKVLIFGLRFKKINMPETAHA